MSSSLEGSVGKSRLQQMRDERYAQEAQEKYEFAQEARQNYEHGKHVREKLTQNARNRTSEIFTSQNSSVQINQQRQNRQPTMVSKENFNIGGQQYQNDSYEKNMPPSQSNKGGGYDNCHDKYDAMLRNAAANRTKEKLSPRSTKFY
jgi:hypothetical protein